MSKRNNSKKQPTALELARCERRALSFVNRMRGIIALKPLARLASGARFKPSVCPLAASLSDFAADYRGDVEPETNDIRIEADKGSLLIFCNGDFIDGYPLSLDVSRFIEYFDRGFYPHLIAVESPVAPIEPTKGEDMPYFSGAWREEKKLDSIAGVRF